MILARNGNTFGIARSSYLMPWVCLLLVRGCRLASPVERLLGVGDVASPVCYFVVPTNWESINDRSFRLTIYYPGIIVDPIHDHFQYA
jgi:hypothetical protein